MSTPRRRPQRARPGVLAPVSGSNGSPGRKRPVWRTWSALAVSYDPGAALGMHESAGRLTTTGFLNFSQALRDDLLDDEFYGGLTVGYDW